jgi:hypothetical protein
MRARSFLILSAVTIGVTAAAVGAVLRQDLPQTVVETGGPVFPGLVGRLGEVNSVVVRDAQHTLTVRRLEGGGWGIAERGDFPVEPEKVRQLVSGLVQLEKAEAKTNRPDLYPRLGVEDLSAPDAKSKEVTLQTASGDPVARIIVGIAGTGVGAEGATYVRIPGEAQTWLARGTLSPSPEAREWVEQRLMQLPTAEIREVRIVQQDGATLTVVREEGDAGGFRLVELPKGATLNRPDAIDALVGTLNDVPLEDLAPVESVEFPAKGTLRVAVTRTDGSKVRFEIVEREGEHWLRFVDGAVPPAVPDAAKVMAFKIPTWKVTPFDRKLSDFVDTGSGS